jgi:transcriptional regulator with XRE-family HTH domain
MKPLAQRIRDYRKRLGLSQDAFAQRIRATVPGSRLALMSVSRWERGECEPSAIYASAIERVLQAEE